MQQYADIYLVQSFAVNKYLHTVASDGFLFALNYDARNHELKIYFSLCLSFSLSLSLTHTHTHTHTATLTSFVIQYTNSLLCGTFCLLTCVILYPLINYVITFLCLEFLICRKI